jgi:hypothetical protein
MIPGLVVCGEADGLTIESWLLILPGMGDSIQTDRSP